MSLLVYNHHSLPFQTEADARVGVPGLIRTWLECKRYGLSTIRISDTVDPSWRTIELAANYRWETWCREEGCKTENRELERAFLSLATSSTSPLLRDGDETKSGDIVDVKLSGVEGQYDALHGAYCLQAPLLGHATTTPWTSDLIDIEVHQLNDAANIETRNDHLLNLTSLAAVERQKERLLEIRNSSFSNGMSLWRERASLFPGLVFCPSIEQSLKNWAYGPSILEKVRDLLTNLDRFARNWQAGSFDGYSHESLKMYIPNLSDESETVKSKPKLAEARSFRLPAPSRKKEHFFFHIKLQEGFRIHYLPKDRQVYVGYIGPHLPLR